LQDYLFRLLWQVPESSARMARMLLSPDIIGNLAAAGISLIASLLGLRAAFAPAFKKT
jgi:hypothetical protein